MVQMTQREWGKQRNQCTTTKTKVSQYSGGAELREQTSAL